MGHTESVEMIKVHFKNAFRGVDQNLAIVDRIWQASDTNSSQVILNNSRKICITSGTPLKLEEGYELAIKSIDINGKIVYLELAKNGNVIDSAIIIPPQVVDDTYIYTNDTDTAEPVEIIKVHFKNAFRGADQNLATIDRIWQVSDTNLSHMIVNNSHKMSITSGTPLKLKEGYELAIKSIDIDGNKIYVQLSKNETIIDSALIIPPNAVEDTYIYSKYLDPAKPIEMIKVRFKNAFRGADQNLATVDRIWQVSDANTSQVIKNSTERLTITSSMSLKLGDGYELAIKSIDIDGNKIYVELSKNETIIDSAQIIPPNAVEDTYAYTKELGHSEVAISVHFKNTFRSANQTLATVDQIWQASNSSPSDVIKSSDRLVLTSGTPLELEEGYELAIRSIDIDGNKVYVELFKDEAVVDSAVIVTSQKVDDIYAFAKDIGQTKDVEIIKVHFKNAFRGVDENLATVDRIWQVSDSDPSHVIFDKSHKISVSGDTPLKLSEEYALAIKSIDINGNKLYVELSKSETVVDSAVIMAFPWRNDSITDLVAQGRYDEAIQLYMASVWKNKGTSFYDLGKYDEAIQAFDMAVEINPQFKAAWNDKGNALYYLGKYDEAVKAYDMAIEIDPQDAVVWNNKCNTLDDWGKYDEAIESYNRAGEIDETYNKSTVLKGNDHYDQGEYAAAIKYYEAAIKQDPKDEYAWYNKGIALRMLHRNSDADTAFTKARELGYNGTMTLLEMSGLYETNA